MAAQGGHLGDQTVARFDLREGLVGSSRPSVLWGSGFQPAAREGDIGRMQRAYVRPNLLITCNLVLQYPSLKLSPEPSCSAPPMYFHPTVRDYAWNKEERFGYVHLHSSPYRIAGRLYGREDFKTHVAQEQATASRLSFSAEKALREFEQEIESGGDLEFKATADDYGPTSPGFEGESKAASTADDDDSTEVDVPSAKAQLLADEAEEEVEREYTGSDPQSSGQGSLMSRARRLGVESEASPPGFK